MISYAVFFLWIQHPYYDKHALDRILEARYNLDKRVDMHFRRSLAKHEFKKNLDNTSLREKLPDCRNHGVKKKEDVISSYGQLNKAVLNDLDNYMKGYNKRYYKKKGLAKLDCYYEKKIFDKIDYINKLAEKLENNKKSYKKKILRKFVFKFILFALAVQQECRDRSHLMI
ncbi:Plasmodium exported protein, unknown function, partial [Plasmodium vivax]